MKKIVRMVVLIVVTGIMLSFAACGGNNSEKAGTVKDTTSGQTKQGNEQTKQANESGIEGNTSTNANSKDLIASFPILPPLVMSEKEGVFINLIKAMQEEYKDGKIIVQTYPFERSVNNIISGKADFHAPLLKFKSETSNMPYIYSTETLFSAVYVLYTNKDNKDINPQNLSKYKVEVQPGDSPYFNNLPESNNESGIQKVNAGRIDGYIGAMESVDMLVKSMNLTNIKRWKYDEYEVKFILPKNERGKECDKIISEIISKLKANGKYQEIMKEPLSQKYVEELK